jgi:hypothetical protein
MSKQTNPEALPDPLLNELGLLTEQTFLSVTGLDPATAANWRSRRVGPSFVKLGNAYYYSKTSFRDWVLFRTKPGEAELYSGRKGASA